MTESRLFGGLRTICVTCKAYRARFVLYYWNWLQWTAITAGLGFIVTGSVVHGAVLGLAGYVLMYLAIVLHELGHFATARLLGIDVPLMSFGGGLRAKAVKVRDTFLLLSPAPSEGLIIPAFTSRKHFRKKALLIFFAGPVTNLAMAVPGLLVLLPEESRQLSNVTGIGLALWTVINLLLGVTNLFPFSTQSSFGEQRSDGAQILKFRRIPDAEIEEIINRRDLVTASIEFMYGDRERSLALLETQPATGKDAFFHQVLMAAALVETNRLDLGVERGRRYLEDDNLGLMQKAMLQNNLAFTLFLRGQPGDLDEAERLSASAHEVLPMILAVKSTRGAVLIAKGRFREGVELLTDKRFRMEKPSHRATVYAMRAEGLAALGNLKSANASLRAAQRLHAANRHLPSASAAIQAASGA